MEDSDIEDVRMSDSDDELELFPIEQSNVEPVFHYKDPLLYCGITRDVLSNDKEEVLRKISLGKSVRVIDNNGDSLLHLAVEAIQNNDMGMIDLLLQQDGIDIDAVNFASATPLMFAISHRKNIVALHLMKAGADLNFPTSFESTPLHCCSRFGLSDVGEALIQAGAEMNAQDLEGDTPLHMAVLFNQLEMQCMLLCYGAELMKNECGFTPFTLSINQRDFNLADILLDYVVDFDSATLNAAIKQRYPNLPRLIERIIMDEEDFRCSLEMESWFILLECVEAFELIWKNFNIDYDFDYPLREIIHYRALCWDDTKRILNIIMNSDSRIMLKLTDKSAFHPYFITILVEIFERKSDLEFIQELCVVLLSYGLEVWDVDLDMVFELFGYCELFKFLLQMDIRFSGDTKITYFPYLIYSIDDALSFRERVNKRHICLCGMGVDLDVAFTHTALPSILGREEYSNLSRKVPVLVELARNKTRDQLCARYKIKNSRQFYTLLKFLDVPDVIKRLISFEIPVYGDNHIPVKESKKWYSMMRACVQHSRITDSSRGFLSLWL